MLEMKNKKSAPIVRDAAFTFNSVDSARKSMTGENDNFVYSRWAHGNPTVRALEEELAHLEFRYIKEPEAYSYKNCLTFASGMAAILQMFAGLVASGFLKRGDEILVSKPLYMTTIEVFEKDIPLWGMKVKFVDASSVAEVKKAITRKTKVVFVEFLANPTLAMADVIGIGKLIAGTNILFVVDNSFGSPYYFRPLEHGAHLVIHSVTKFISGHGDVIAGAIIGEEKHINLFIEQYHRYGACMSPDVASLVFRSCKTFDIRLKKQGLNAFILARWLVDQPKIKRVHYPGLDTFVHRDLARTHMDNNTGYGGMISIDMHTPEDAKKFLDTLAAESRTFDISVSLGFTNTRGEFDAGMVHVACTEEEMQEFGLSPTLIRLTIGIEDIEDIKDDFADALSDL